MTPTARTNSSRRNVLLAGAALVTLSPLVAGCGSSSVASSPKPQASAVPTVTTGKPVRRTFRRIVEQPGQVEAYEHTPIYANISGYVGEVCVDMNARVKKDQVLARLTVPELDDEVKQKEALVVQGQAELEQERKALAAASASLVTANARIQEAIASRKRTRAQCDHWASEERRMAAMFARKVIEEQSYAEARFEHQAAQAACEETEAKIGSLRAVRDESAARLEKQRADVTAAEARLTVARATERRARSLRGYAEIKAPYAGIVIRRNVHPGHLPGPGKGEPLFVMLRMDRVRIFVDVPEADAGLIVPDAPGVPGTRARIRIQALNDREIEATVTRTSGALDPVNRTLRAEVELPNPGEVLRPGMYAYASFTVERSGAWAIPLAAVVKNDEGSFCYCVQGGKVRRTAIRLGTRSGGLVEILKKRVPAAEPGQAPRWQDMTGAEVIVQANTAALTDGQEVATAERQKDAGNAAAGVGQ